MGLRWGRLARPPPVVACEFRHGFELKSLLFLLSSFVARAVWSPCLQANLCKAILFLALCLRAWAGKWSPDGPPPYTAVDLAAALCAAKVHVSRATALMVDRSMHNERVAGHGGEGIVVSATPGTLDASIMHHACDCVLLFSIAQAHAHHRRPTLSKAGQGEREREWQRECKGFAGERMQKPIVVDGGGARSTSASSPAAWTSSRSNSSTSLTSASGGLSLATESLEGVPARKVSTEDAVVSLAENLQLAPLPADPPRQKVVGGTAAERARLREIFALMSREELTESLLELTLARAQKSSNKRRAKENGRRKRRQLTKKLIESGKSNDAMKKRLRGFTFVKENTVRSRGQLVASLRTRFHLTRPGWYRLGFKRNFGYASSKTTREMLEGGGGRVEVVCTASLCSPS